MRDVVPFADGNAAIDPDVQIDVKRDSHFSHQAFLDIYHAWHRRRRFLDPRNDFAARRRVEHLAQGRNQKPAPIGRDDGAGEERCPVIRAVPFFAANQRDGNPDERGDGSDGIGAMMPGIGLDRGALDVFPDPNDYPEKKLLHRDDNDQDDERERRGTVMRRENFPHALDRETDCGDENAHGHDSSRQRFDPSAGDFRAWARRIATNAALDHLRHAHRETELSEDYPAATRDDPAVRGELRDHIRRAFLELPAKYRFVATLALIEDEPYNEIAEAVGISAALVKVRVFRAVGMLRKKLNSLGVEATTK